MKEAGKARKITWDEVEILIIGAGIMGASLAQAYAQSGFNIGLIDVDEEILKRAFDTIDAELQGAHKSGIFSGSQVEEIKNRILGTTSYEEACRGKSLKIVVESATEDIQVKKEIFKTLDNLCAPHVILATNTSSLNIDILARETKRPDKVVWMHFFYLPHKNRAGEYARSEKASPESIAAAAKYMKLAGKVAAPILSSRKGGAADVIFVSLLLEAARMVEEGIDIPSIEAAGRKAFDIPIGFLGLMDHTGIPLGILTMYSFSDSSDPDDALYRVYHNFFTPPGSYKRLMEEYEKAEDKLRVKWVSEEEAGKEAEDWILVDVLKNRFLAVAFMTAAEVVDAGVIDMEEVERLCQNAFLWKEGPFTLMNKLGIREVMRIVTEKMELSHRKEINFPIPRLLISQAQKDEPWPLRLDPVIYSLEQDGDVARVMISNPKDSNALDHRVFDGLRTSVKKANEDDKVKALIFDSAPIKTFIAGANVRYFIRKLREGDFQGIREETALWQDVIFQEMAVKGKPKIAIVDGAALGGGAEVALAFSLDPDTLVIATDRTSYSFPETRLGIYPGLRGTLTLSQVICEATGDSELALALGRYYILGGGAIPPRVAKFLGLADFLVPARMRDDVAEKLTKAIIANQGKPLTREQMEALDIQEIPFELTPEEKKELRWMKELFLKPDPISIAKDFGREEQADIPEGGAPYIEQAAHRMEKNSPFAMRVADVLITQGFDDFLRGKSLEERAMRELDNHLVPTFQHPDALEGLTALMKKRIPRFKKEVQS